MKFGISAMIVGGLIGLSGFAAIGRSFTSNAGGLRLVLGGAAFVLGGLSFAISAVAWLLFD
jgi:hypothetical protein